MEGIAVECTYRRTLVDSTLFASFILVCVSNTHKTFLPKMEFQVFFLTGPGEEKFLFCILRARRRLRYTEL